MKTTTTAPILTAIKQQTGYSPLLNDCKLIDEREMCCIFSYKSATEAKQMEGKRVVFFRKEFNCAGSYTWESFLPEKDEDIFFCMASTAEGNEWVFAPDLRGVEFLHGDVPCTIEMHDQFTRWLTCIEPLIDVDELYIYESITPPKRESFSKR